MRRVELRIDVGDAAGLGEPLSVAATAHLPDARVTGPPVVVAFPGGGYGRRYYDLDLAAGGLGAGREGYSQAEHLTARGAVVVAVDHLATGESSVPSDPFALGLEDLAAANAAATDEVVRRLVAGTLAADVPPVTPAILVGIGQSMGGCILTVQQGRHRTFDAVGFLGWSNVWSSFPDPSGGRVPTNVPGRGDDVRSAALPTGFTPELFRYCFHYDDVPADVVERDLGPPAGVPWRSEGAPPCAVTLLSPGVVAEEAAAVDVPVLVAAGERDVVPDPRAEPVAYPGSSDVTVTVVPRMGHMHNFAGTRRALWDRMAVWVEGVAELVAPRRED
ncbi:MAG TPA: hypothetical protein VKG43_06215 [Acidimicrobiales bacterium]|nr:hypothetical protein [Acidimicrobiales bacterium]